MVAFASGRRHVQVELNFKRHSITHLFCFPFSLPFVPHGIVLLPALFTPIGPRSSGPRLEQTEMSMGRIMGWERSVP